MDSGGGFLLSLPPLRCCSAGQCVTEPPQEGDELRAEPDRLVEHRDAVLGEVVPIRLEVRVFEVVPCHDHKQAATVLNDVTHLLVQVAGRAVGELQVRQHHTQIRDLTYGLRGSMHVLGFNYVVAVVLQPVSHHPTDIQPVIYH